MAQGAAPELVPVEDPAEAVSLPEMTPSFPEEEPAPRGKPPPAYRGAEMREAFKGAGSRYGVSGRVHKIPAKKSLRKPKDAWRRSLSLGLNTAQGNSDTLRVDAEASASKDTEASYFFLKAAGRYGESEDETDAENATLEGKIQRRLTERMYAAMAGNVHRDQLADLSYRVNGSLSLGRQLMWTERTVLSIETGPGYVAEKKGGESEGFVAGRVAQHLEFLATPSLQVWESIEYVPSLEDSRVYYVNAEVGLETVLMANLSLKCTLENRYDNNPAEGKERNDLLTTTALTWSF